MSITVSIKVRKELVDLADKMVKLGISRSRSHAFNIMIEKGLKSVYDEVMFWENVYNNVEHLKKTGYRIRHGGLLKILKETRE